MLHSGNYRRRADAGPTPGVSGELTTLTGAATDVCKVGRLQDTMRPPTTAASGNQSCHAPTELLAVSEAERWVDYEGLHTVPVEPTQAQLLFLKLAVESTEKTKVLVMQLANEGWLARLETDLVEQTLHALVDLCSLLEDEQQRRGAAFCLQRDDSNGAAVEEGDGERPTRRRGRRGGRRR